MTTFSYSSGDPSHLVAGGNATMADMQGPLVDLRTFLNGNISDVNLSSSAAINENKFATGSSGLAKGTFSAFRGTALTLASLAVVTFDNEDYDVSGWFNTTNGRFVPQTPGYYRFSWSVEAGGVLITDAYWQANLRKNGTIVKQGSRDFQRGAVAGPASAGAANQVANGTTDFFEVAIFHNNGGSPAVATGSANTYFSGELIGRI